MTFKVLFVKGRFADYVFSFSASQRRFIRQIVGGIYTPFIFITCVQWAEVFREHWPFSFHPLPPLCLCFAPSLLSAGSSLIVHRSWTGNKPATTANNWRWAVMNSCPLWNTHTVWALRQEVSLKQLLGHLCWSGMPSCPVHSFAALKRPLSLYWTIFFKDSELRDKEEPVTGLLTGANQPGHSCGKYQRLFLTQDLHCVTRHTDQTAPMCEIHDLSDSYKTQGKEGDALLWGIII